jgi:ABC-type uncharacterized transport system permease subunit
MDQVRNALRRLLVPTLALVTAFAVGAFLLVLTDVDHLSQLGTDPLGAIAGAVDVVIRGYGAMFGGSIGDPGRIAAAIASGSERDIARAIRPITEALLLATPLLFMTLGVGLALHARLFNLGAHGQFLFGSLGATLAAVMLDGVLPPPAILVAALAAGTLVGAAYGFIPGFLKARTGAHELITTLMLNTIAFQAILFVTRSFGFAKPLPKITSVPRIFDLETIRLDWGLIAALGMAAVTSYLLFRTRFGFELRATGFSRTAARAAGMEPGRVTILAMSMSGGLVGMGGAFLTLGPAGGLAGTRDGFIALALALLAGLRPSGVVLVVLLYAALQSGAGKMVIETGTPLDLLVVVIAITVMFVAAPGLIRSIWRLKPPGPDAEPTSFRPTGDVGPL